MTGRVATATPGHSAPVNMTRSQAGRFDSRRPGGTAVSGSVGKLVMNGADPGGPHDRRGGAITFISPCGLPLIPR